MASSGVIYGSVSQNSSRFRSAIYWRINSQDVTNNTSNVTVEVLVDSSASASYDWDGTCSNMSLTINGSTYTTGSFTSSTADGWTYSAASSPTGRIAERIWSKTVTVAHNSDGTKTCSFSMSFSLPSGGWGPGNCSASGSGTFNTIARASQPTLSASSVDYGASVTISTHRASTSFTHTLRYSWNSSSGTIATGVTDSYAWTVPTSLMNNIPNATSSWGTIYCDTYSGSTLIGTKSVTLTTTVPASVVPTFSSVTISENNTAVTNAAIGAYVQGVSKLNLGISGEAGAYSSTITKYEITFEGVVYGDNSVSNTIKGSGTLSVVGKITDSRGRTASQTVNITVLAYAPPTITTYTVKRANSDGTLNDMGTYAKVTRGGSWSSLNNKNTLTINIKSSPRGANSWTTNNSINAGTTGSYAAAAVTFGTFSATSSFDFRLEFVDVFNTTISLTTMSTGQVTMSWGPSGIGIGKVWQSGALDVYGDINIESGNLNAQNINGTTATFSGDVTINGADLTIGKNGGTTSKIIFPAQTNDAGYISHVENNNQATMYFCVSDDNVGTDYFSFGSTPSGTYDEAVRIGADGTMTVGSTLTTTGYFHVRSDGGMFQLHGSTHGYFQFYVKGDDNTRSGWMGYGSGNSNSMSFSNAIGDIEIIPSTSGKILASIAVSGGFQINKSGSQSAAWWDNGSKSGWSYWQNAWAYYDYSNGRFAFTDYNGAAYKPIYGGAYTNASSERWKRDIKPLAKSGKGIINSAKVKTYRHIESWEDQSEKIGLIAEEAPAEILNPQKDGVDLYSMISLAWKAIQELSTELDTLRGGGKANGIAS